MSHIFYERNDVVEKSCSIHGKYSGHECLKCYVDFIGRTIERNLRKLPIINDPNVDFTAERKLLQIEEPQSDDKREIEEMGKRLFALHDINAKLRAELKIAIEERDKYKNYHDALVHKILTAIETLNIDDI